MNTTDPFADIPLDPDTLRAATAVRDRMALWIDNEVRNLKDKMNQTATLKAQAVANQAQQELATVLDQADDSLATVLKNLNDIQLNFTDAGVKAEAAKLTTAISNHRKAVAEQKAKLQAYGAAVGSVIQKALLA